MRNIFSFLAVLFLLHSGYNALAQQSVIYAGPDDTICGNGTAQLTATIGTPVGSTITTISLNDDQYSGVVNIGFPFNYYGTNYSQCLISSNNYITFNTGGAGGFSPWVINNAVPNAANPTNSIMCPWQDIHPGVGGQIKYSTVGTAPNRIFVVNYIDIPMFSCTQLCFSSQVMLYETSNIIETHIFSKPLCAGWNGGNAIHSTHNNAGSLATTVPGRNFPTQWSVTTEGRRFVPNGTNSFTQSVIPFNPIVLGANGTITWRILGGAVIGTGATINVSPTVNTTYVCSITNTSCGSASVTFYDTVRVLISNPVVVTGAQNADCLNGMGGAVWATATGNTMAPFTFTWNTVPPTVADTAFGVGVGTYTVSLVDANGCTSTGTAVVTQQGNMQTQTISATDLLCNGGGTGNLQVEGIGATPPYTYVLNNDTSYNGIFSNLPAGVHNVEVYDSIGCSATQQVILNEPTPLNFSLVSKQDILCHGQINGSFQVSASGGVGPYLFSNTIVNNSTGNFPNMPQGVYTLSVTDANACYKVIVDSIVEPPLLLANINPFTDITCFGANNGQATADVTGGVIPYTYNWNTNPAQASASVTNLPPGTFTVLVTDNNGCTASASVTATEPMPLIVQASADIEICEGFDTLLTCYASGGTGTISYLWTPIGTANDSVTILPSATTTYTITVTDQNNCMASEDVLVTVFGTPNADFSIDLTQGCAPVCPRLTDLTSWPAGSVNTFREWDFGDAKTSNDSVVDHCYNHAQSYNIILTVITDKGCRSAKEMLNAVEVYPLPEALFEAEPAVTSILNPNIKFKNNSTLAYYNEWSFGDNSPLSLETEPSYAYADTGQFIVRLLTITDKGCVDSTSNNVVINPYFTFFIPTSFSPNNDGRNDKFEIMGDYIKHYSMEIYDRWGKLHFSQQGSNKISWDGNDAPQGSYIYRIVLNDTFDKEKEYFGTVTLFR